MSTECTLRGGGGASSAKHTQDPGLTAGRVQLLRVSETSGVETHTHHAVSRRSRVRAWLSGGSRTGLHVTSSVHHDISTAVHYNGIPHQQHAHFGNGHLRACHGVHGGAVVQSLEARRGMFILESLPI
jgi:hypothetical protein